MAKTTNTSWKNALVKTVGGAFAKALTPKKVEMSIKGDASKEVLSNNKDFDQKEVVEIDLKITIELEY